MSSICQSGGSVEHTEFQKRIESGQLKFEYNLFDLVLVDLFLVP